MRGALKAFGRYWQQLLLGVTYVCGWGLLTWGVAQLTVPEVWAISGGLFLLSLGGLGLLKDIALEGLYVLSRVKGGSR
jgi:hypothetical protein